MHFTRVKPKPATPTLPTYQEITGKQAAYREVVVKYSALAERDPASYARKVKTFSALGYFFIGSLFGLGVLYTGAILLLLAYAPQAISLIKVAWIPLIPLYLALKAFFKKAEPRVGLFLERNQVPKLFEIVDEISQKLSSPKIDNIILDQEYSASAAQVPWFGPFGPFKNYLHLGFPYLLSCGEDELRAVIAHELGHFAGGHGAQGSKIYRQYAVWEQFSNRNGKKRGFLKWYLLRLSAMTFALRRRHEFEADSCAVNLYGASTTSRSLVQFVVCSRYFNEVVTSEVYQLAADQPEPPVNAYEVVREAFQLGAKQDQAEKCLTVELAEEPSFSDEHPSLTQRLQAMGISLKESEINELAASVCKAPLVTAAEAVFGDSFARISASMGERWSLKQKTWWHEEYKTQTRIKRQLEELEQQASEDQNPSDFILKKAKLIADSKGLDEAMPMFHAVLETDPENATANYAIGLHLFQQKDTGAEPYLLKAVEKDSAYKDSVGNNLATLFHAIGDSEKAGHYFEWVREAEGKKVSRENALKIYQRSDKYELLELSDEQTAKILEIGKAEKVKAVFAVRKLYGEGASVKMVFVVPNRNVIVRNRSVLVARYKEILRRLVNIGGLEYSKIVAKDEDWLLRKLKKVHGARVYPPAKPKR
ncbi:MAG TPA: M48 family metallopeptidase [Fimbriimonadaceae bacterium]